MSESNGQVSYSVKELLAKLDGKIDGLFAAINNKADRQDLAALDERVKAVEIREARVGGSREWLWRICASLPGVAALVTFLHH